MTNYNERLNKIIDRVYLFGMNGGLGYEKFDNELSPAKAKQALISLIKELVAETRIDELKHLVNDDGIWYQDMTRKFPQKIRIEERIKELEV